MTEQETQADLERTKHDNKDQNDIKDAFCGGVVGSLTGLISVLNLNPGIGFPLGFLGSALISGIAPYNNKNRPRHYIIGGLSGLAIYGAMFGGKILGEERGYEQATEKSLTPFETADHRGISVIRKNGTQTNYIFIEGEELIPFSEAERNALESLAQSNNTKIEDLRLEY
ncbi:MAG: hypothetical protein AABY22_08570, partial [Nanoarchaeota archaeon]